MKDQLTNIHNNNEEKRKMTTLLNELSFDDGLDEAIKNIPPYKGQEALLNEMPCYDYLHALYESYLDEIYD